MRTTVSIDDELLGAAKRRAAARGESLGSVVEDALRRLLVSADSSAPVPPELPVFRGGTGPQPGVDLTSTRALHEVLDDGAPLTSLR
ncbi:MAG: type II toxin-antitoxin system VapB family antitoxin [Phycicoccus sp.]